jgi:hypothetical protein
MSAQGVQPYLKRRDRHFDLAWLKSWSFEDHLITFLILIEDRPRMADRFVLGLQPVFQFMSSLTAALVRQRVGSCLNLSEQLSYTLAGRKCPMEARANFRNGDFRHCLFLSPLAVSV